MPDSAPAGTPGNRPPPPPCQAAPAGRRRTDNPGAGRSARRRHRRRPPPAARPHRRPGARHPWPGGRRLAELYGTRRRTDRPSVAMVALRMSARSRVMAGPRYPSLGSGGTYQDGRAFLPKRPGALPPLAGIALRPALMRQHGHFAGIQRQPVGGQEAVLGHRDRPRRAQEYGVQHIGHPRLDRRLPPPLRAPARSARLRRR